MNTNENPETAAGMEITSDSVPDPTKYASIEPMPIELNQEPVPKSELTENISLNELKKLLKSDNESPLYKKISAMRAEIITKDWSDDKMYSSGVTRYSYLSADKVKRTLGPLFSKHGLEFRVKFSELTPEAGYGNVSMHWAVRLDATLIDVDTGEAETSTVYGEAGDVADKGIIKAQTAAIKQWVLAVFFIADGIDPDAADSGSANHGSFRNADDQETVRSRVLAGGVAASKTVAPLKTVATPKTVASPKTAAVPKGHLHQASAVPNPAPAAPKAAVQPAAVPKKKEVVHKTAPSAPVTASEPSAAATAPVSEGTAFKPSEPQKRAVDHIVSLWFDQAKTGKITGEKYAEIQKASLGFRNVRDVTDFIKKYRSIEQKNWFGD